MNAEKLLSELVERLLRAYSRDLRSVLLYGSAAGQDFDKERSDLNILCVLRDVEPESLEKLEPIANWWRGLGHPAPLLFGEGEIARACDAFPIEFLDIRDSHRLLHGDDPTGDIAIEPALHRVQVEHEVRSRLIALRQRYLGVYRDRRAVVRLMVDSLPSFITLFRHALLLAGERAPERKRDVLESAAQRFGFEPGSVLAVLDLRAKTGRLSQGDARATFHAYYRAVMRLCEHVDTLVKQNFEQKTEAT